MYTFQILVACPYRKSLIIKKCAKGFFLSLSLFLKKKELYGLVEKTVLKISQLKRFKHFHINIFMLIKAYGLKNFHFFEKGNMKVHKFLLILKKKYYCSLKMFETYFPSYSL